MTATENILPTVDEAVQATLSELNQIEADGGPKTWGGACRFAQMVEFVKAMGSGNELTKYQRGFFLAKVEETA